MKKVFSILALLICGLSLSAQSDTSGRSIYRHTPEKRNRLFHTKLKVSFDLENNLLYGEEWLTAEPHFYPADLLELDAKSMLIHEVSLESEGKNKDLGFIYKNDLLQIFLDRKYEKGEKYTVYIKYTAQPDKIQESGKRTFSDTKGLYFIKNKENDSVSQIWTQGQTEYSSCWFPTIDKPNQKSTQEIHIRVPEKYTTLSNGLLQSSTKHNDGSRTDHWVMNHKHSPYLFFMAAGEFAIVQASPWRGKVPINYYVEKGKEDIARQAFSMTSEMLEFYSNKFRYDFPWPKYSQIVLKDFIAGGMENTTAVAHSISAMLSPDILADRNYWEFAIAHEIAHHWFGNLVTAESWANLAVNEAFANYAEYLWFEYKYGRDEADFHLGENNYEYLCRPEDFAKPAVRFDYEDKEDVFDKVSYNKAGAVLHMLRDYLGDEAFFESSGRFLKRHEFGTAEMNDLRHAFEEVSGKDLNWFFNQWFFGSGHPEIEITHTYSPEQKTLFINISQTNEDRFLFEFPLEIDIYEGNSSRREYVWIEAKKENVLKFPSENKPLLTDINPRGVILMNEIYDKTDEEYHYQYINAKDFKSRNQAVAFAIEKEDKKILLSALRDPSPHIRAKAMSYLPIHNLNRKELDILVKTIESDNDNLAKAAGLWALAGTKNKRYIKLFEKGLKTNSAAIKNSSLHGIALTIPEKARNFLALSMPDEVTSDQMLELLPVIIRHRMEKYLPGLMAYLIYYPFNQWEASKAESLKKGYEWAMSLDNTDLVRKAVKPFIEMKAYMENGEESQKLILKVLENGLRIKNGMPQSLSVIEQKNILNNTIELITR